MKEAIWSALYLARHGGASTYRGLHYIGKERVYALHFVKKKGKRGIATPKEDIALIRARFAPRVASKTKHVDAEMSVAAYTSDRSVRDNGTSTSYQSGYEYYA